MTKYQSGRRAGLLAATLAAGMVVACSSDTEDMDGGAVEDAGHTHEEDSGVTETPDSGVTETPDSGVEVDAGEALDAGGGPMFPEMPEVLSLRGCDAVELGPLCAVSQTDDAFVANCSGAMFDGTVTEGGDVTMTRPEWTNGDGDAVTLTCSGTLRFGRVNMNCVRTTTPSGGTPVEDTCTAVNNPNVLPGIPCMELPSTLTEVTICTEGAAMGGETIEAGTCEVIQDGCVFQAACADRTLVGSVGADGMSFDQTFMALADAESNKGEDPAFVQGDSVSHSCSAVVDGTSLTGSCGAGRLGRRGTDTSVCSVGGGAAAVAQCAPISSATEQLFALDACEILEDGEGGIPGIGQPVCALRQNNCVWEINCGSPLLTFSGRVTPGSSTIDWRLATGTPCEVTFDEQGQPSGACTVPGQPACSLESTTPAPGGEDCPVLPVEDAFTARGCGDRGGTALDCRVAMQHRCNFAAVCSFTGRFPSVVISGQASYSTGDRGRLEFNGLGDFSCYVDEATADEVMNDNRAENEWHGQCTNPSGGMCRDNYDPKTGEGFRGLQVFMGGEMGGE